MGVVKLPFGHRRARNTGRIKPRKRCIGIIDDHPAVRIAGNAPHHVVTGGLDGNRFFAGIHPGICPGKTGDFSKLGINDVFAEMG